MKTKTKLTMMLLLATMLAGAKCGGPIDGTAKAGARGSPPDAPSDAVAVPDTCNTGLLFGVALASAGVGALVAMGCARLSPTRTLPRTPNHIIRRGTL